MRSKGFIINQIEAKSQSESGLLNRAAKTLKFKSDAQANSKFRYQVENGPGLAIGFYEMMFRKQSNFIYRVRKDIDSFFLRRSNFKRLLDSSKNLSATSKNMKKLILYDYVEHIYRPIQEYQNFLISQEKREIGL